MLYKMLSVPEWPLPDARHEAFQLVLRDVLMDRRYAGVYVRRENVIVALVLRTTDKIRQIHLPAHQKISKTSEIMFMDL